MLSQIHWLFDISTIVYLSSLTTIGLSIILWLLPRQDDGQLRKRIPVRVPITTRLPSQRSINTNVTHR